MDLKLLATPSAVLKTFKYSDKLANSMKINVIFNKNVIGYLTLIVEISNPTIRL